MLAALGGALGFARALQRSAGGVLVAGRPLPLQVQEALRVDLSIVAICVGLCLVTSLVFGFLPAPRFSRPVIISALKDDAGVGGFRRRPRSSRDGGAAGRDRGAVDGHERHHRSIECARPQQPTSDSQSDLLYAAPLELDAARGSQSADFRIRSVRDNLAKASGVASVTVADGLPLDFRGRSGDGLAAGGRERGAEVRLAST